MTDCFRICLQYIRSALWVKDMCLKCVVIMRPETESQVSLNPGRDTDAKKILKYSNIVGKSDILLQSL